MKDYKFTNDPNRPVISITEMKVNDLLLNKAFNTFKTNYNTLAKAKNGIMTIQDMNNVIGQSLEAYKEKTQREQWTIEGFYELIMGLLPTYGDSITAFKVVKKMFGWR